LAVHRHKTAVPDAPDEVEVAEFELLRASHRCDVDLQALRLGRSSGRLFPTPAATWRRWRSHLSHSVRIVCRLDAVLNALAVVGKGRDLLAVALFERGQVQIG